MLTRQQVNEFKGKLAPKLQALAKELGWNVKLLPGKFSQTWVFKVEASPISADGKPPPDPYAIDFQHYASIFGLKPTDLGRTFVHFGRTFKIVGLNRRAHKMPIIAADVNNGRRFKFSAADVQNCLK